MAMGETKKLLQQHCCIWHEFHIAATRNPNKIAVIHASSEPPQINSTEDQCFTFADILASVASLASRLGSILNGADDDLIREPSLESGYRRPKVIGIYMPPSVEYIISVLSILSCGEAFLPLDPCWPRDRILSVISCSNAACVIACGTSFAKKGWGCQPIDKSHWILDLSSCPVLCFSMKKESNRQGPMSFSVPCEQGIPRSFCYLMYTSGSTGKPKGVCGTEQGLLNRFLWMQELYPLHGEQVLLFKTSISFIDHLQEFLAAIFTACTLVIPPFTKINSNIYSVIDFLKAYSVSRFTAVPSLMRAILPALQSHHDIWISSSLKLLVISGEVLPLSLWKILSSLLPKTSILNLYGSTEVSGDCSYFDCKMLPSVLEKETLSSVPIGLPISNCDVVLIDENDNSNEGEIYVGGMCVSIGYISENTIMPMCSTKLHHNSLCSCSDEYCGSQLYFKTGDFARRLPSGDLVFLGRKDRTVKIYGQRIALEEIEDTFRGSRHVADAAVICHMDKHGVKLLVAFVSLKDKEKANEMMRTSIRIWMTDKLPSAMIPNQIIFLESLPKFASGKIDYRSLEGSIITEPGEDEICDIDIDDLMQTIKKVFCIALMVEDVSDDDDFFVVGGNSIAAAHVSHTLGIDMRMLYAYPTPSRLLVALTDKKGANNADVRSNARFKLNLVPNKGNAFNAAGSTSPPILGSGLSRTSYSKDDALNSSSKRLKVASNKHLVCGFGRSSEGGPWKPAAMPLSCSFSRSNKIMPEGSCEVRDIHQIAQIMSSPISRKGSMKELWKVNMESCIDASPVVVFKDSDVYLFVGSHSHKFLCVNAKSGYVHWEISLQGRIEASAAVVSDFSQVVVGCYGGEIYFLDFLNGNICWTFRTSGEVKCQPLVDAKRQLVWCGSHDQNLYALDYKIHCCVYKLPCGGSIFGSPAIDEVQDILYVASTSGRITAILLKDSPFHIQWLHELQVPIFGSLCITSPNRYVICCLVDGHVLAFDSSGSIIWKYRTGGPIFAGACTSIMLPSQVLINSRNGSVYSFDLEKGGLVWEIDVGDPITSSAYVDENLELFSGSSVLADRLVCICTSSGVIILLGINMDEPKTTEPRKAVVQEFARVELEGDVFSSPVMIGGRIFVGCRDNYLRCIVVENPR